MNQEPKPTYDTETVRILLDLPNARDVRNLTKPGKALFEALIRDGGPRGRYDVRRVRRVRAQMIRRRLAEKLGRTSPRFLPDANSWECPTCKGIAVAWGGKVLCENGHEINDADHGVQNVK